jgi:hypothetical protein
MTRQWDIYLKEGGSDYAMVNPHNFKPIFTSYELTTSIHTTYLIHPIMRSVILMDVKKLYQDILVAIPCDPITKEHLDNPNGPASPWWSKDTHGFIRLDRYIYMPDADSLHLRVLQYSHDHPILGHFGINKTLSLIQ